MVKKQNLSALTLLCAALASLQIVRAATVTVTSNNDIGAGSLRNALTVANTGDTIAFDPSLNGQTITLTSGVLVVAKNLTISGPGANQLVVDANHASGVFTVNAGLTVTISGLTITHGGAVTKGAGIYNNHATLTVNNSIITGNSITASGGLGGGIYIDGSGLNMGATLTINNSTVSGNSATSSGGAIYNTSFGGGSGSVTINTSTVSGNSASSGGGIYNYSEGFNSTFDVPAFGSVTINSSTISGNSATGGSGGGILSLGQTSGSATLTINNSTVSGNSATGSGGAILNNGDMAGGVAALNIKNSTLSGNSAAGSGGGIYSVGSLTGHATAGIGDTIFQAGASGLNIAVSGTVTTTSLGFNLSSDNESAFLNQASDKNSIDPMLDPNGLQNNGGPTLTIALQPGSPAIDQGKNMISGLTTDQRGAGFARIHDDPTIGNAAGGDGSDIGAFEYFVLKLIGVSRAAAPNTSNVVVTFQATQGGTYRLQRKLALTDSTWQSINGVLDLTAASTGSAQITDTTAPIGMLGYAFYRVVQL